jgi:hypothetical protein
LLHLTRANAEKPYAGDTIIYIFLDLLWIIRRSWVSLYCFTVLRPRGQVDKVKVQIV